jgi:hypothetical protein
VDADYGRCSSHAVDLFVVRFWFCCVGLITVSCGSAVCIYFPSCLCGEFSAGTAFVATGP